MLKRKTTTQSLAILGFSLSSLSVSAATMYPGANFTMLSASGGTVGSFNDVTGNIGGGTWSVASSSPFFGNIWNAHSGTTFGPGSYTFDTVEGGVFTGVQVGVGQIGGHILFDWSTATNTDVVNVWDVAADVYTSTAVTSGAGTNAYPGLAMIDGPFPGFNVNFNFEVSAIATPVPAAVWLFGSGLLGLVGLARRKKRRD